MQENNQKVVVQLEEMEEILTPCCNCSGK